MKRVLILTDGKAGHENQSKAFARAIGCEAVLLGVKFRFFGAKTLSYILDFFGVRTLKLISFAGDVSSADAVIGAGSGTFYAVKAVARARGIPSAAVLYPRGYRLRSFTCILAPRFDNPRRAANVIEIPANLVAADEAFYAAGEKAFLERYTPSVGRPACAVIVGGPNKCSTMTAPWLKAELEAVFAATPDHEHWLTTSRRTPHDVEAVAAAFPFDYALIYSKDHFNPIPAFVKRADVLYVSAESTGMLSEACTTGTAEVRVMDNLKPGGGKFRRFVELLRVDGHVDGRRKIDLSAVFARARVLLGV